MTKTREKGQWADQKESLSHNLIENIIIRNEEVGSATKDRNVLKDVSRSVVWGNRYNMSESLGASEY